MVGSKKEHPASGPEVSIERSDEVPQPPIECRQDAPDSVRPHPPKVTGLVGSLEVHKEQVRHIVVSEVLRCDQSLEEPLFVDHRSRLPLRA